MSVTIIERSDGDNRVLTTDLLVSNNQIAKNRRFNHLLRKDDIERLDPDGYHVIEFNMLHDKGRSGSSVRCLVLLKVKGTMAPQAVLIDIVPEIYNELPTAAELKKSLGYENE